VRERAARSALPDADAVWETEAENVLGVLNGLRSSLDVGEAEEHLRQAKKWFTMGERADAFEDADDLAAEIEEVEELLELVAEAREQVGELTSTMPELRAGLQEAAADDGAGDDGDGEDDDGEDDDGEDDD